MNQDLELSRRVGKNLKHCIKNSKFKTQENFAKNGIFVESSTLRRWLAYGLNDINTIEKIANVLEIDYKELFK